MMMMMMIRAEHHARAKHDYPSDKIWLWRQRTISRPYRRWGRGKGVGSQPVGGGLCYSWGEILHFKHLVRFGGKSHGRRDF